MPTIALSMIVKNAADTIGLCLESVRGLVDQIVIADTGCTDNTCDIARGFGAIIVSSPWENHYAKARNAALAAVTSDWVLVLDADEELDRQAKKRIPRLMSAPDVGGYSTPIRNYVPGKFCRGWDRAAVANDHCHDRAKDAPAFFVHENVRFFRRHPGIYFIGRVHEIVEHRIKALGMRIPLANFFIHHFGQLAPSENRESKGSYYLGLLRLKVQDDPGEALGWIQLGLHEYEYSKNPEEALRCLERGLALEPRAAEAWLFKSMIYVDLGRYEEALAAAEHDRREGQRGALREQVRGDALHCLERFEQACTAFRRAIKWSASDPLLESKLGYTEVKMGQNHSGLNRLRRAAQAAPGAFAIHDRFMKACILTGRLTEAAEVAEALAQLSGQPLLFLRAASIHAQIEQWDRAERALADGLARCPDSEELRAAYRETCRQTDRTMPAGRQQSIEERAEQPKEIRAAAALR
jgi:glycosyltransferase involved in cell wall biosynthesis